MENTIWEIEGQSFEFDIADADAAERYDMAAEKLCTDIPECKITEIGYAAFVRTYCKAHRAFYDMVFGEPVSEKIFANISDNIRKYNAIYAKFLAFVSAQGTAVRNETREIVNKYKPKDGKK